jgi:YVTN family beta-propeller protein
VSQPNVSQLAVIDVTTSTLQMTIPFGWIPLGLTFGQDGGRLYVTDRENNTISAFDPATNRIVGTLTVGTAPVDVTLGTIATRQ